MEIITEKSELAKLQETLEKKLKEVSNQEFETIVGPPGGSIKIKVYYSEKLGIWFGFRKASNRYWNPFGIGQPKTKGSNIIIVEINIPFEGRNRSIAGVFVRDDDGKIWLGHSGKIGGGRPEIGYRTFWEEYTGERVEVQDDGKTTLFARIGYIDSEDFPEKVRDFVFEVNRIKNIIAEEGEGIEEAEEKVTEERSFALTIERDIKKYLTNNLESLESGLTLYQEEYSTKVGRIDILATDKKSNFVVIEIKAGTADLLTFAQISSYMGSIQEELAKNKKVRGIIVASDFDEKLKAAVLTNPSISLKKYKVYFEFEDA